MAAKSDENWNFSTLYRILLYYPAGQKVRSKSLYLVWFSRYSHFFIFRKNPRCPPKVAKNEIFPPLYRILLHYSAGQKVRSKSLYLVRFLGILTFFHFPQKSKMAAKSGENWNFSPLHRILFYYPVYQKFARNRSISYSCRDIHTFSFSAKIQDGHQKWQKLKFFPLP